MEDELFENDARETHTFDMYVEAEKSADEALEEGREYLEFIKRERGHRQVSCFGFRKRFQEHGSDVAAYTFQYFTE
ncbi:hypothetical protein B2J88_47350 [Rhodococcus sp. SRB_17]|nr:hypothetical protein [Rhodococcus sp. SRB_17]